MENEKRLIDANALKDSFCQNCSTNKRYHRTDEECRSYRDSHGNGCFKMRLIEDSPTVDAVEVVHAKWEDGSCSNCGEEALSTSLDEPIYDYDWEENLRYSHTETHTEYHLTDYCPNCGAKMDGGNEDG